MSGSAEQRRAYAGPVLLSHGFRPLFLLAGLWGVCAMALWLGMLTGAASAPTAFDPVSWHIHELLFGYLPAVVAGFLLTAVPNWTGRLPVIGAPLAILTLLWIAGRGVVLIATHLPQLAVAVADMAFLAALGAVIGREIMAGRNWRNLPVLALVGLLLLANALFHAEGGQGGYGMRLGVASSVFLIALIGGRVTPSFTRNWLARRGPGALPAPLGRFDAAALAIAGTALTAWIAAPAAGATGALCVFAGLVHVVRLGRWAGWRTGPEPLVWVLHAGYGFAALGFLLVGGAALAPDLFPRAGALHAWMVGAVGVMTLGVMTRASLGHSGRALTAGAPITAIYVAAIMAALARIGAGWAPSATWLLHLSAAAWIAAFAGFVVVFAPILARPRAV